MSSPPCVISTHQCWLERLALTRRTSRSKAPSAIGAQKLTVSASGSPDRCGVLVSIGFLDKQSVSRRHCEEPTGRNDALGKYRGYCVEFNDAGGNGFPLAEISLSRRAGRRAPHAPAARAAPAHARYPRHIRGWCGRRKTTPSAPR